MRGCSSTAAAGRPAQLVGIFATLFNDLFGNIYLPSEILLEYWKFSNTLEHGPPR
jgi:hypothetical protein